MIDGVVLEKGLEVIGVIDGVVLEKGLEVIGVIEVIGVASCWNRRQEVQDKLLEPHLLLSTTLGPDK